MFKLSTTSIIKAYPFTWTRSLVHRHTGILSGQEAAP